MVGDLPRHDLDGLKATIAVACRILANAGLVADVLGHVSVRTGPRTLLVRCRGPRELGLLHTTPGDVHEVDFDGHTAHPDYRPPQELPIHVRSMERRPDAVAVVHAHPPAVVAADLGALPFVPLIGAYNIPAARLAADGIPVYRRGVLIRRAELADEMLDAMGDRPVCVLRGHGLTTLGTSVEQAVVRALAVDELARMLVRVAQLGAVPTPLPAEDLSELPDLGSAFNEDLIWRHHEQRLRDAGFHPTGDAEASRP
jgi:3,4-dihydroxyphthalate decarboxylase